MGPLVFAAIAIVYLAFAFKDKANAVAGAAVLLPYNQYLPGGGIPLLNIQTLCVLAILMALLQNGFAAKDAPPRPAAPRSLGAFALIMSLSYIHAFFEKLPDTYASFYDSWNTFITFKEYNSTLLIFYAAFVLADSADRVRKIFWGAVAGWGGETVFCFLEFVVKGGKVTGHLEEANRTGAFLATYAALAFGVFLAWKGTPRRWLFLGSGLIGAVATMGTRSRGGFLALGAAFLLVSFIKSRILFVILLILAFNYQAWAPQPLLDRLDVAYDIDDSGNIEASDTAASRIEIWKAGLRTMPEYPAGLGFGLYAYIVPKYGLEGIMSRPMKNAHNDVVLILVEMSVFGLLAWVLLLGGIIQRSWAARRDPDPLTRALGYGALAGLLGDFAASLAGTYMLPLDVSSVLWVVLGVASRQGAEARAAEKRVAVQPAPIRAVQRVAVGQGRSV